MLLALLCYYNFYSKAIQSMKLQWLATYIFITNSVYLTHNIFSIHFSHWVHTCVQRINSPLRS